MTSSNFSSIRNTQHQSGIIAIELALIITIIVFIFSFSVQLGQQFYWQQHFNHTADRFVKLLALDIQITRKVNQTSFSEALDIVQNHLKHKNFTLGLNINVISDDIKKEESFFIGSNCKTDRKFVTKMEELVAIEPVNSVQHKTIPTRYLLGLSLCAQPKSWIEIIPFYDVGKLPLVSQSYYPINHKALQSRS